MDNNKKVILIGPPETGKTTIQKVFFEMANPFTLLENSLEPTKGVNYNIYSFFNSNLGVFDLAGQENDRWFSIEKKIFSECNLIICVFDIRNSLEKIVNFLINIMTIKKVLKLHECKIIVLIHKIDLIKPAYIQYKIEALIKFFTTQYKKGINFKIFRTSIAREFFFQTYNIMLDILALISKLDLIPISKKEFTNLKTELYIIIKTDNSALYNVKDLSYNFKLNFNEIKIHLARLNRLGFVKIFENFENFQLTERAFYFKEGIVKEMQKADEINVDKGIELFYTFLNLIPLNV